jgi:hypothetical protein
VGEGVGAVFILSAKEREYKKVSRTPPKFFGNRSPSRKRKTLDNGASAPIIPPVSEKRAKKARQARNVIFISRYEGKSPGK